MAKESKIMQDVMTILKDINIKLQNINIDEEIEKAENGDYLRMASKQGPAEAKELLRKINKYQKGIDVIKNRKNRDED